MIFKLALKNITAKPFRAVATVLIIAVAVALLFCVFSFKEAVYQYIYEVETVDSGNSDILITSNSTSDRIADVSALHGVEGVKNAVPSLSLYTLLNGEYVKLRGFDKTQLYTLHGINAVSGDVSKLEHNSDNIIISERTAEHFMLKVGDAVTMSLGTKTTNFYVSAIASCDGYFTNDSPYVVIGVCNGGVARLINSAGYAVYNEVYVQAEDGVNIDALKDKISALPSYSEMSVNLSKDDGYIETQSNSMSAPVIISGLGVLIFSIACIVLVLMMSVSDKRDYLAKLTVVGATKKQVAAIFAVEALILAFVGAVIGSAISGGLFLLLIKVTLSQSAGFTVSALKLCGAAVVGVLAALCASLAPAILAFRSSVRENEIQTSTKSVAKTAFPIALLATAVVSIIIENTVPGAKGALSLVNVILVLLTVAVCVPYLFRLSARLLKKCPLPAVKIAAVNLAREKRPSRALQNLTVGMTVAMMLFMAWSLTTTIFTGYLSDFEHMVMVTNVQSSVDNENADGIAEVQGVNSATPMVWRQGEVSLEGKNKTINVLGSENVLDIIDFKYITERTVIEDKLNSLEDCAVIDIAYSELYGIKEGDKISLTIDNVTAELTVAGVTSHRFFSGNYAVISKSTLKNVYGAGVDTVLVVADDAKLVAERIRSEYADKNYYTVEALTAYEWDAASLNSVFDLVGSLAFILAFLVFLVSLASSVVSHSYSTSTRATLLSAGMSKNSLLLSEMTEYSFTALTAFVISFAASAIITASLIGALRLFGLYFTYMYRAWVVAAVGGSLALGYSAMPLILSFKRGYNMKRM